MKRPDRNEIMNKIRAILGLPLPNDAPEYFSRNELLEILSFINVRLSTVEADNNDNKIKKRSIQ